MDHAIEPAPLNADAILGARQLVHKRCHRFHRPQLRVVLHDHEQAPNGALKFASGDSLVVDRGRPAIFGTRVRDRLEDRLFLSHDPLDGINKIRNEVVAPLVLGLHLRPLGIHGL